jgi:hypothetical protein
MSHSFRRGFKAEVEQLVEEVRRDFGRTVLDALDPLALAAHLCIPVIGVSALPSEARSTFLASRMRARFHAATIPLGTGFAIVHNDTMARTRQASNIAHELGHVFLEHQHIPVNAGQEIARDVNDEAEANWFGFALLVPAQAAFHLARIGVSVGDGAEMFGVSEDLMRMRLNATGARRKFPQRHVDG